MAKCFMQMDVKSLPAVQELYRAAKDCMRILDLSGVGDPTDVPEAAVNACEAARDELADALLAFEEEA